MYTVFCNFAEIPTKFLAVFPMMKTLSLRNRLRFSPITLTLRPKQQPSILCALLITLSDWIRSSHGAATTIGPRQFTEKFIPLILSNALHDEPIPVYGDGRNVRDWIYVEDHCRAILRALQNGRAGAVYNIGARNERRNIEVVE